VADGDVPMEGRVEVVGDLDEDATGGVGGGEVPGGDGSSMGFFDDDVAEDLEGLGVEVFGVDGEDVFDGVGVFGGVQPFAASGGGLGGASPGGVEEGDVPMEGRVEVVGDLDEDATGGDGGGEVPGGDGPGV